MIGNSQKYALATAVLACAPAVLAVQPATASGTAAARCHGHQVTVHGTDGDDHIRGTKHRDVIRTGDGDDVVRARRGNDIVCTGRGADVLKGGPGRDRLDGGPFKVVSIGGEETGARADRFVGGAGNDRIIGGGSPATEPGYIGPDYVTPDRVEFPEARGGVRITERGVVTGRGVGRDRLIGIQQVTGTKWADHITVRGQHVVYGEGGADRIDVLDGKRDGQLWPKVSAGPGKDRVDLSRHRDRYYEVQGGPGADRIVGSPKVDWLFDTSGGGAVRGGGGSDDIRVASAMSVLGGDGDDQVRMAVKRGPLGSVHGGAGRDQLGFPNRPRLRMRIDVPAGRFEVGSKNAEVGEIERFGLPAVYADATFIGSDGADRLSSNIGKGHTLHAKLGGGDDRLTTSGTYINGSGRAVVHGGAGADLLDAGIGKAVGLFFGGDGDDSLQGGVADDELRGGPGEDTADGFQGDDLCRAETTSRCER